MVFINYLLNSICSNRNDVFSQLGDVFAHRSAALLLLGHAPGGHGGLFVGTTRQQ